MAFPSLQSRLFVFAVFVVLSAFLLSFYPVKSEMVDEIPTEPRSVGAIAFAISPTVGSIAQPPLQDDRTKDGSEVPVKQVNESKEDESPQIFDQVPHDVDNAIASFTAVPMPTPLLSFDGIILERIRRANTSTTTKSRIATFARARTSRLIASFSIRRSYRSTLIY